MKFLKLAPLAFFALTSVIASAEGAYVLGELTHSRDKLDSSYFDSKLGANGAVGAASTSTGSGNEFRIQGGYRLSPNLAVEGGYIDFGKTKYQATYAGGTAQGTLKAGGVDIAARGILPVSDKIDLFAKGGLVAARVKSSLTAGAPAGGATGDTSKTVVRPLLGIGAQYKLTEKVSLRLDLDHVSGLGSSSQTGKMSATMLSGGLAYSF
ncbi:outer membrane beta-barrel protein [soil metagenome]